MVEDKIFTGIDWGLLPNTFWNRLKSKFSKKYKVSSPDGVVTLRKENGVFIIENKHTAELGKEVNDG